MDMNDLARRLIAPLKPYFLSFDGTRDLGRGTAFPLSADLPGGLQTSDRFFRTDLGWLCYYDGTRWLTVHDTLLTVTPKVSSGVTPQSTPEVILPTEWGIYISRVIISTVVSTTNNVTNFWTVSIQTVNTAVTAGDTIYTFNTSGDVVNVRTPREAAPPLTLNPPIPTNRNLIRTTASFGAGAPGALEIICGIRFRLIIT